MSDENENSDVGRLTPLPSGNWSIVYSDGSSDHEIHAGDTILLEVEGNALCLTRIEYDHQKRRFYSIHGFPLKVGRRAARGSSIG